MLFATLPSASRFVHMVSMVFSTLHITSSGKSAHITSMFWSRNRFMVSATSIPLGVRATLYDLPTPRLSLRTRPFSISTAMALAVLALSRRRVSQSSFWVIGPPHKAMMYLTSRRFTPNFPMNSTAFSTASLASTLTRKGSSIFTRILMSSSIRLSPDNVDLHCLDGMPYRI